MQRDDEKKWWIYKPRDQHVLFLSFRRWQFDKCLYVDFIFAYDTFVAVSKVKPRRKKSGLTLRSTFILLAGLRRSSPGKIWHFKSCRHFFSSAVSVYRVIDITLSHVFTHKKQRQQPHARSKRERPSRLQLHSSLARTVAKQGSSAEVIAAPINCTDGNLWQDFPAH